MSGTDLTPQPGNLRGTVGPSGEAVTATIDNRTELPNELIQEVIMSQWVETAGALQLAQPSTFQMYSTNQGSMLNRMPFQAPRNVFEEIKLARQVSDSDDDVKGAIGSMYNIAFGSGMENLHPDEKTTALYNKIARDMNLDMALKELYREYLIAAQFTTVKLFKRSRLSFTPDGTSQKINAQLSTPVMGIVPAEDIRVTSNDLFGQGELAYLPSDPLLKQWLDEFLGERTSAPRKAEMARDNPVLAALFTKRIQVPWNDNDLFTSGQTLYVLNPRMVHRTTMPKGAAAYPRPLLTANFALLEAKRLLNIMDYALLQGGTNYIVVAKQGSDQLPAKQPEIDNLVDQVRSASRSGVLVGDHRVDIEIITPKLEELLNPAKRKLIGRKIAMALLRMPEQVTNDAGTQGATNEMEFTSRTISADRLDIRRHVERHVYDETADRNPGTFTKGAPALWFPRIILAGVKDFFDAVKDARDRGDIPRAWAVEALGYNYDAGVAQRKREKARGDDEVMTPGAVPFSNPMSPPGRPAGSGPDNGRPGATPAAPAPPGAGGGGAPRMRPPQPAATASEDVRAEYIEERGEVVRIGVLTESILEQYPEHAIGRITDPERQAVDSSQSFQTGSLACIPVNVHDEVAEVRAIRLEDGLSMIVGQRTMDGALIAKAMSFREPHWNALAAEDTVLRFGYALPPRVVSEEEYAAKKKKCKTCGNELPSYSSLCPDCGTDNSGSGGGGGTEAGMAEMVKVMAESMATAMAEALKNVPSPNITIQMPGEGEVEFIRDPETGAITGKRTKAKETPSE